MSRVAGKDGRVGTIWAWWPRDVLLVSGPEAVSFLQGQVSQDVAAVGVGESKLSFVLQPQGKVDALVRLTRRAEDAVLVDVDGGFGPAVAERLGRFKLRVKAEIVALPWRCLAVRGPGAGAVASGGPGEDGVVVPALWPGVEGVDVLGPAPAVPPGTPIVAADELEWLRVRAGMPAMGRELTERTIPAETGLVGAAVSFTKGCFTGQELVARIDSRGGHVPRHLRCVVIHGDQVPPAGAAVVVDGRPVGEITSAARGSWTCAPGEVGGEVVALAYVRREVEVPVAASVEWDGLGVEAGVAALP